MDNNGVRGSNGVGLTSDSKTHTVHSDDTVSEFGNFEVGEKILVDIARWIDDEDKKITRKVKEINDIDLDVVEDTDGTVERITGTAEQLGRRNVLEELSDFIVQQQVNLTETKHTE